MARIERSIEVKVPLQTAYNQWTQFEEFPRFMEGIQEVHQVDDARLTWVASIGGERKEWYARITQQVPDQVVAWESEGGAPNAGIVTFHRLGADKTEVNVQMDYEPEDFKEAVGDKLGFVSRRVEGDLKRFKEFIEERGRETGAWRGRLDEGGAAGGAGPAGGTASGTLSPQTTGPGGTGYDRLSETEGRGPGGTHYGNLPQQEVPGAGGTNYGPVTEGDTEAHPGGTHYGNVTEGERQE